MAPSQDIVKRQHELIKRIALDPWQHNYATLTKTLQIGEDKLDRAFSSLRSRGYTFRNDKSRGYYLEEAGWEEAESFDKAVVRQIRILRILYSYGEHGLKFPQIKEHFPEVKQYELNALAKQQARTGDSRTDYERTLSDEVFSEKTLREDMEALVRKGLIVKSFPEGIYSFNRAMSLPPLYLNEEEKNNLQNALDIAISTQPLTDDYAVLRGKLTPLLALDQERRPMIFVQGRRPWQDIRRTSICHRLSKAIRGRKELLLIYRSGGEEKAREITVNPLGLIFHWALDNWYLNAMSVQVSEIRTYAVERILLLEETGNDFTPPADYDVSEFYRHCWGIYRSGESKPVKLSFANHPIVRSRLAEELRERPHSSKTEDQVNGRIIVEDLVDGLPEMAVWLRTFGHQVEVIEPPELKSLHCRDFQRMLAVYKGEE